MDKDASRQSWAEGGGDCGSPPDGVPRESEDWVGTTGRLAGNALVVVLVVGCGEGRVGCGVEVDCRRRSGKVGLVSTVPLRVRRKRRRGLVRCGADGSGKGDAAAVFIEDGYPSGVALGWNWRGIVIGTVTRVLYSRVPTNCGCLCCKKGRWKECCTRAGDGIQGGMRGIECGSTV
jgi:hypothetical protein